jgi:peptidoglycan/LPS O-acetylase OafA/YrhL
MLKPLTSLRFFFAFFVFLSHLTFLEPETGVIKWIYSNIFYEGYLGVSFFFILSGFILAYNYQDKLIAGKVKVKHFYYARISRIYPLHLLTFIAAIPFALSSLIAKPLLYIGIGMVNLLLLQSFFTSKTVYFSYNSPSWSISDEMFFYLCFPLLIFLVKKLADFNISYKMIGLILFLAIVPVVIYLIPKEYYHPIIYINPVLRIFDFIIGIMLFNFYKVRKVEMSNRAFSILEAVCIATFIIFFCFHNYVPRVYRFSIYYWIPMAMIILTFAYQRGIFSRILSHPIFILLGEASFAFYLFHQIVIRYYNILNNKFFHIENYGISILLILIATITVSILSYKYFEIGMNKKVKKYLVEKF